MSSRAAKKAFSSGVGSAGQVRPVSGQVRVDQEPFSLPQVLDRLLPMATW
jgi:hypothetical protein